MLNFAKTEFSEVRMYRILVNSSRIML